MKKPSGSAGAKQASSARPGFQPSAAAQFPAIEISSGRIVRMLKSLLAGDREDGLMDRITASESRPPKIERYGRAAQDALEATHYGVYGLAVEGASRDLDPECWIRWDLPASPRIGSAHPFGHRHMAGSGPEPA